MGIETELYRIFQCPRCSFMKWRSKGDPEEAVGYCKKKKKYLVREGKDELTTHTRECGVFERPFFKNRKY
jgi:hypothetical protein